MASLVVEKMFNLGDDTTEYRLVSDRYVEIDTFHGRQVLLVSPEALKLIAKEAFIDCSFHLRPSHFEQLAKILDDEKALANDKFVAASLLKNAIIMSEWRIRVTSECRRFHLRGNLISGSREEIFEVNPDMTFINYLDSEWLWPAYPSDRKE